MREGFDYKAMGVRIRNCRRLASMTQEELAEKAYISPSFVGHIERGEKQPSLETIVNICKCLKVNMDYVVMGQKRLCMPDNCSLRNDLQKLVNAYPIDLNEKL